MVVAVAAGVSGVVLGDVSSELQLLAFSALGAAVLVGTVEVLKSYFDESVDEALDRVNSQRRSRR